MSGPANRTLRTPADIIGTDLAPSERLGELESVAARYAIAITPAMAGLMATEAAGGPISRQFLPDAGELETTPSERADPIGDAAHEVSKGLIHRYPDRVLLKLVSVCAVYCRFCFRREMVGPHNQGLDRTDLERALAYIRTHPEVWEVIVSGGDPLVASPRRLRELNGALAMIDHVKIVRFHTRVPIVSPELVTAESVDALRAKGVTTWLAIHANHPDEFTPSATDAIARLVDSGVPLVSQTVLLKGINDDPEVLATLMRTLVEHRIKPYYLHHGDLAPGTAAFRTTLETGQDLMRDLRRDASGLCQPVYVLDIPGGHGKVPVGPGYLSEDLKTVDDPRGKPHRYPPEGEAAANGDPTDM